MRPLPRVVAAALVVPLLTLTGTADAGATAPLACGDALTVDTTLTGSLTCQDGPGLRIDTPGVTLDLAGHTVAGTAGIGISVTADDVVVRGGTVTGFPVGVYAGNPDDEYEYAGGFPLPDLEWDPYGQAQDVLLDDVEVSRASQLGVEVAGARVRLTGSALLGNDTGARAEYGGELHVSHSELSDNGLGVQALEGGPVWIDRSLVRGNGGGASCSESAVFVADSVVADNHVGLDFFVCGGSTVVRSVFTGNVQHIATEGFPTQAPSVGCTVFVLGGPAPDLPRAPCW